MSTNNTSMQYGRKFQVILLAVLAVILLAGAAYLWGSRLNADTPQANTQRSSEAASTSRYGSSLGIAAVRAADASASRGNSLRGVAGVRVVDQAANASSSLRADGATQGLSNLETQRAKSQTQGLSNLELLRAKQ